MPRPFRVGRWAETPLVIDPKLEGMMLDGVEEAADFGDTWEGETEMDGASPDGRDEKASEGRVGK